MTVFVAYISDNAYELVINMVMNSRKLLEIIEMNLKFFQKCIETKSVSV